MILVDSSVWVDYFRDADTWQVERLDQLLGSEVMAVGDLMLAEVLQGFTSDRDFREARRLFAPFVILPMCDQRVAVQAARHHRTLRAKGVTVRKTIDTIIATRCILDGHTLLHADRDFDPFERHLGLRVLR